MMRILILTEEFPPNVHSGLGVHYDDLSRALAKKCEVVLISARRSWRVPAREKKGNLEVIRIWTPSIFPLNHIFYMIGSTIRGYFMEKDLTDICSPFGLLYACMPKREPIVLKLHSVYQGQHGSFVYSHLLFPLGGLLERFLIARSDQVHTISKYMKDQAMLQYGVDESKIKETLNGVDFDRFQVSTSKKDVARELGLDGFDKIVLCVGRIVDRKAPLNLVGAIAPILEQFPGTGFVFIGSGFTEGSGYAKAFAEAIQDPLVSRSTRHIEWIDSGLMAKYYRAADIYCHPAVFEPFGNVVAEAAASGLAVVTSPSGGPEEIVAGGAGIVMTDGSSPVIAENIIALLRDENHLLDMQTRAKRRAKSLSWDTTAAKTASLYSALIEKYKSTRRD
jgi:glycosyltransferase involved in cell wall biosynthesis